MQACCVSEGEERPPGVRYILVSFGQTQQELFPTLSPLYFFLLPQRLVLLKQALVSRVVLDLQVLLSSTSTTSTLVQDRPVKKHLKTVNVSFS